MSPPRPRPTSRSPPPSPTPTPRSPPVLVHDGLLFGPPIEVDNPPPVLNHDDLLFGPPIEVDNPPPTRRQEIRRNICARLNRCFVILTYPCVLIFTVISLLMIVTFCVFPTLVCLTLITCIYYCLMEDPIPLSVLLRYVLSPDGEETAYPNLIPLAQQRSLIQSKLIIRKVLRVRDSIPSDDSIGDYPRKHPFPIQVSTERKCLHFSEPIVIKEPDDKKNKEEDSKSVSSEELSNPIPIPHYQRPQDDDNDDDDDEQFDEEETTRTNTEISSGNQENDDDLVEIVIGRRKEEEDDNDGDDSCTITFEKKDDDNEQQQDDDDYFGINEIRDRGTACDICLLEFEVGDDVAWSPNLDCIHSFHKDCVLDWLVRKPTCPNCRHDYLTGKQDDVV